MHKCCHQWGEVSLFFEVSILLRSGKNESLWAESKFGQNFPSENMFRFVLSSKPQETATCTAANKFPQYQENNYDKP